MKKIFYFLCLCINIFYVIPCFAEVTSITDPQNFKPNIKQVYMKDIIAENLPDPNDREAVRKFFKKRLEEASTSTGLDLTQGGSSAVNIIHTPEYYAAQKEAEKPVFQKMYEEAVKIIQNKETEENNLSSEAQFSSSEETASQQATRFFTISKQTDITQQNTESENIPTVSFALPSGRKILAPAIEHIPYFLSYIDVMSNGYLKVEDTIVVVADGKKFARALRRVFPKYAYDINNKAQRIELILNQVTINGTTLPYTAEEFGNNIIIKPKHTQKLQPGVYTYVFDYMVNNTLSVQDNNVYMHWNLTGVPLNSFITSANAIVTLPSGHGFKGVQSLIGRNKNFSDQRTNIIPFSKSTIAFSSNTPLMNGEVMDIITVADRNAFLTDFNKGFNNFLLKWGNIFYASIGLLFILISYILSLVNLHKEKQKNRYNPSGNGSLMRQISVGKYDRIALVAQVLDLFRKDALDIISEQSHIVLSKKNTEKKFSSTDKKALKLLFSQKKQKFEPNHSNVAVIKKIKNLYEKNNKKLIRRFNFLHNAGYLLFSVLMLILTEIFIAFINTNMLQSLIVLLTTSAFYAFYIWMLRYKFKKIYTSIFVKLLALSGSFLAWLFSSVYIGILTSLIIFAMIFLIFEFTKIFAEKNSFMNDAKKLINNYQNYLLENIDSIGISRDFINHQAAIFALDISDRFSKTKTIEKYYRLDVAEALRQQLIGVL